jgi:hypothetical protein
VLHERLWRAWSVQKRSVPISPAMYFSPDGLALGAGTILLPAVGPRRLADLQGEEARLLTLLAATYGKAISPSVLGGIERAAKCWHEGDDMAALDHLVDAGLPPPVDQAEEARRLFVTDAFIKAGTHPLAILQMLGLDAAYVEIVAKLYNPLEPRVPAGNGVFSGRWTKALSFLGDLTATQATQLGLWASRFLRRLAVGAEAVDVFRLIFIPSDNRIRVEGDIKGLPGGHYAWNRDETEIHIDYLTADGEQRRFTAQHASDRQSVHADATGHGLLPAEAVLGRSGRIRRLRAKDRRDDRLQGQVLGHSYKAWPRSAYCQATYGQGVAPN